MSDGTHYCPHGSAPYVVCGKCWIEKRQNEREDKLYESLEKFSEAIEQLSKVLEQAANPRLKISAEKSGGQEQ